MLSHFGIFYAVKKGTVQNQYITMAYCPWAEGTFLSDSAKFIVFKFQAGAQVNIIGQKCQGDLGFYARVVVFDQGVITENIDHSAEHIASYENRPR